MAHLSIYMHKQDSYGRKTILSHACENATKIFDLVVQNVAKKVFCPNVRLGELQILILEGLS